MSGLNEKQQQAAVHTAGPLLIIAGAGTGKTKTVTHRIVNLMKSGVPPHAILAITFTNKAASEMRERVLHLMDNDQDLNRPVNARSTGGGTPFMSTFHSLGVFLLREFHARIGLKKGFTIYDRADSTRVVKQIITDMGYDPKQYEPRTIMSLVSRTKGEGKTYEHLLRNTGNPWKTFAGEVMRRYDAQLAHEGALDFDDLLSKTVNLLRTHQDIRELLHARWTHIHIDEYQDTNAIQFEMAQLLTGKENNICVVGDTDQLIYSWRGAQLENLLSFEKEFPNTTVVILEENYRSTQRILEAANAIIEKNSKRKDKILFTKNTEGALISIHQGYTGEDEARYVAQTIRSLTRDEGVDAADIAVLYRANFLSRSIEDACFRADVPYQVLGTRFFERAEVKDVLSYIRAAKNPDAPGDISRAVSTPPRGIGKTTLSKMLLNEVATLAPAAQKKVEDFMQLLKKIENAGRTLKPSEVVTFVIQESGLEGMFKKDGTEGEERLQNVRELVSLATKYDELEIPTGLDTFLDDAALAADQDALNEQQHSVKLMTIHAAKGLEFKYVFLIGLEQGVFPSEREDENKDDEEERRLMYVAVTRAREKLYISYAMMRTIYGQTHVTVPSEFISDIPSHTIEQDADRGSSGRKTMDLIDF